MSDFQTWYNSLTKPSWTPSPDVIGTIWTILYPIIIGVDIYVLIKYRQKIFPFKVLLPFIINIIANLSFTPVQFGLRNLDLAAVVILIVWGTIIWSMIAIWPYSRLCTYLFIPYLVWVSLASVLQLSISWKN